MPKRRVVRCKVCNERLKAQRSREIRLCSQHDMGKFEDEPDTFTQRTTKKCLRGHTEADKGNLPDTKWCQVEIEVNGRVEKCRQEMKPYP